MAIALKIYKIFKMTNRRNFILAGAALTTTILTGKNLGVKAATSSTTKTMPERILGKTGVSLPIFGLGGAGKTPISKPDQEKEARSLIEKALSLNIRYYDTAASYGPSEAHFGKVLPPYRNQIFLASKTAARDYDGAWQELERSLKRLNTDYLDLWQLHHVSFHEELDQIFGKTGAIKALEEAQQQKLVRFSGITGHHEPDVIAAGLQRYPFDTTLICLNAADIHHPRPFIPTVLPVAQENNVGVIAMKVPAYGKLLQPGVLQGMHQALGYTLSLPGVHTCIVAAENPQQLESNVRVAETFQPLSQEEMTAIEQLTANAWEDNTFFRKWT